MDSITAATLTALAGGAAGEVGRQSWQGLWELVRRPFRRGGGDEQEELPGVSSGEVELRALEAAPTDPGRAQALATTLGVRAVLDPEFGALLDEWWTRATADSAASVQNNTSISGGKQTGAIVQGRDFSNLTFRLPGDDDRGH